MEPFTDPDGPVMRPRPGAAVVALFDGDCAVCTRSAAWFAARDAGGRVERVDLRRAHDRFPGLDADAVRALMHVVDADGRVIIGLDAVRAVLAAIPGWAWAATALGWVGVHGAADVTYRAFARNRLWFNRFLPGVVVPGSPAEACDGDACAIDWDALARSEHAHANDDRD